MKLVPITQVNDPVFAGKMMGIWFAGHLQQVVWLFQQGEVVNVFPTLHAGIQTGLVIEVLVHMGIDTADERLLKTTNIAGKKVDENTDIDRDLEALKEAGKDTAMMVLFTNMDKVESIVVATEGF